MTNEEIAGKIEVLSIRVLALREVVARLLANQAADSSVAVFTQVSETMEDLLHSIVEDRPVREENLKAQEQLRLEGDWIVARAQIMRADDGTP